MSKVSFTFGEENFAVSTRSSSREPIDSVAASEYRTSFSSYQPAKLRPAAGVTVRGIETAHDHHGGAHRGKNTVMVLEAEDLCLVHLGDLGHLPGPGLIAEIGQPDVLFLPVGGYYTVDAREADQVRALLGPAVTIPMHYRTEYDPGMKIAPLSDYLSVSGAEDTGAKLLRVTRQDLSERPAVLTMAVR